MNINVSVQGRVVNGGKIISVGVQNDNLIDTLTFEGLPEGDEVILGTVGVSRTSRIAFLENNVLQLTSDIMRGGILAAQLIVKDGEKLWHSHPFQISIVAGLQFDVEAEIDPVTVRKLAEMIVELKNIISQHISWTDEKRREITALVNEKLAAIENVANTGISAIYQTAYEETAKIRTTVAPYAQDAQKSAQKAQEAQRQTAQLLDVATGEIADVKNTINQLALSVGNLVFCVTEDGLLNVSEKGEQ